MINYIFLGATVIAFLCGGIGGNMTALSASVLYGAKEGIQIAIGLMGIMCFWSGIMKIGEKAGGVDIIARLIRPVTKILFKDLKSKEALHSVTLNICANLLGMGNAATPFGIKAIRLMDKENGYSLEASDSMCMLVIINTASIQLLPTTLFALMVEHGEKNPFYILPYVWICSVISLMVGVLLAKAGERKRS